MTNGQSLFFYIISLLISALFFYFYERFEKRVYLFLALLIPTLVGGLRYMVGADFLSYTSKVAITDKMSIITFFKTFNNMEPGLWALGKISNFISGGALFFFIFSSFLTILMYYLGYKKLGNKYLWLFMLLILLIIFPQSLSGVRQGMAMSMVFFGLVCILRKEVSKGVIIIAIAGLIHFSALLFLGIAPVMMFVSRSKGKPFIKQTVAISILFPVLILLGLAIINYIPFLSKYAHYKTTFAARYSAMIGKHNILPEVSALAFALIMYKRLIQKTRLGRLSLIAMILMFYSTSMGIFLPLAGRFADYFYPFFFIILIQFVDEFDTKRDKKIIKLLIILFGLLFFIGAFYIKKSGSIFPYSFIF